MRESIKKLSPEDVLEEYSATHDSIFKGGKPADISESPFVNAGWERTLLPYGELKFSDVDFFALMQAAQAQGKDEIVITSADEYGKNFKPPMESIVMLWDRELINELQQNSFLGNFDTHIFDQSGAWGIASYWDHYFCVGGGLDFMNIFTKKAGGRSALKERFLDYAKSLDWYVTSDVQKRQDFKMKVLRSVGWDR